MSAQEVALSAGSRVVTELELSVWLTPDQRTKRSDLKKKAEALARAIATAEAKANRTLFAVLSENPKPTHLLLRGNAATPAEVIEPGPIAALADRGPAFDLKANAEEGTRRAALRAGSPRPKIPCLPA